MTDRVIVALKQLLAEAEKGDIAAIAVATIAPDLSSGSAYTLGDGTLAELLGSIALLKHRIMRQAEKGELD